MKKIAILGSTGSIGTQTLDIVRWNQDIAVKALAAGSNIELLEQQIKEFSPDMVCVWEQNQAKELKKRISNQNTEVLSGMEGLIACAAESQTDMVITAVVGMIGIQPTLAAIEAGKTIALANKETLVTAGHLVMPLAKEKKVEILPVDSEHSAIFQALNGESRDSIARILLTASGGPFRGKKQEDLKTVTIEDALKHPNWSMGKKITIDSATMVNKGLEVIEAKWLFHVPIEQIQVVIQPQSVIHSMVEFEDGSVIAQMGTPDMHLPISYALSYPKRKVLPGKRLDFTKLGQLTFEAPDMDTFYGLRLAYEAGKTGGSLPVVLNAANEEAVRQFLNREIAFYQISERIQYAMEHLAFLANPSVSDILEIERDTYHLLKQVP